MNHIASKGLRSTGGDRSDPARCLPGHERNIGHAKRLLLRSHAVVELLTQFVQGIRGCDSDETGQEAVGVGVVTGAHSIDDARYDVAYRRRQSIN